MQEAATQWVSGENADSLAEGVAPHPKIMQTFENERGAPLIRGDTRADGTYPRENGTSELSSSRQPGPAIDNSGNNAGTVRAISATSTMENETPLLPPAFGTPKVATDNTSKGETHQTMVQPEHAQVVSVCSQGVRHEPPLGLIDPDGTAPCGQTRKACVDDSQRPALVGSTKIYCEVGPGTPLSKEPGNAEQSTPSRSQGPCGPKALAARRRRR